MQVSAGEGYTMQAINMEQARDAARNISDRVTHTASDTLARMHDTLSPNSTINVGEMERVASTVAGGVLLLSGFGKGSLMGIALGLGGAALIHRGLTGHCAVYDRLGKNTAGRELLPGLNERSMRESTRMLEGALGSAASGA